MYYVKIKYYLVFIRKVFFSEVVFYFEVIKMYLFNENI